MLEPQASACAIEQDSMAQHVWEGEAPAEPLRRRGMPVAMILGICSANLLTQGAKPSNSRDAIYENAKRRFAKAIFYKPESNDDILPSELAPLIVQEVVTDAQTQRQTMKFGRVYLDDASRVQIDLDDPTVYVDERTVTIQSHEYAERVFALYFRPPDSGAEAGTMQSIHTVLDANGFPLATLVWDVWFQERRQRCCYTVFTSEIIEDLSRERFGPPLTGERFSIQRQQQNGMYGDVGALFSRGPIPMGPYVYLSQRGYVSSVLCRCSPSQMDEVTETRNYRLEPIEKALATRDRLTGRERDRFPVPPSSEFVADLLDGALRWPFDSPKTDQSNEDR